MPWGEKNKKACKAVFVKKGDLKLWCRHQTVGKKPQASREAERIGVAARQVNGHKGEWMKTVEETGRSIG